MPVISTAFLAAGVALIVVAYPAVFRARWPVAEALCAAGNLSIGTGNLIGGNWGWAIVSFALAAWCGWDWWRHGLGRRGVHRG
jgi:hypothetical protein